MKIKPNLYMLKAILNDFGSMVWVSLYFSIKNKIGQKSSQSFLPFGCFIWLRDHTIPNTTNHLLIRAYKWPFWLIIMSLKCLFPLLQQRQERPKRPKGGKWKPEILYLFTLHYEHSNLLYIVESRIQWRQMTQKGLTGGLGGSCSSQLKPSEVFFL